MWVVNVPIMVQVSKNKRFSLNLNQYRNAHHHTLNKAKVTFAEEVIPKLKDLPRLEKIRISYILYARSKQLLDIANVCSIVDKFFCDCLVQSGVIPDDNRNHVINTATGFGGIDPHDPRVECVIESLT